MFKEIVIVLTKPICDCSIGYPKEYSINTSDGRGLTLSCAKCKKEIRASMSDLNGHVRVRVLPVIEGGAKVISFEGAKKNNGIVD